MSLFKSSSGDLPKSAMPVSEIDLGKRYDIYSWHLGEERLYEDVKIVGIKVFRRARHDIGATIGGYLELEAPGGTRMMIPQNHVQMLCEHGVAPIYKVISDRASRRKADSQAAG